MIGFVNKRDIPADAAARVHEPGGASAEETWRLQREHAFPWRRTEYSDHRSLPLGIVLPMRVDFYDRDEGEDRERHSIYRIRRVEVNPELPEETFRVHIPPGTTTHDFTVDPRVGRAVTYEWGSERAAQDWDEVLSQEEFLQAEDRCRRDLAEMAGSPAPELSASTWLNSAPLRLEDLRGRHVLLVFSSVHCGPCRREAPRLPELALALREHDARLIGVFAAGDKPQEVRAFAEEHGLEFPICIADGQDWGATFAAYHVHFYPTRA